MGTLILLCRDGFTRRLTTRGAMEVPGVAMVALKADALGYVLRHCLVQVNHQASPSRIICLIMAAEGSPAMSPAVTGVPGWGDWPGTF